MWTRETYEALRAEWERHRTQGHRVAVLEEGVVWSTVPTPSRAALWSMAQRQFEILDLHTGQLRGTPRMHMVLGRSSGRLIRVDLRSER